MKGVLIIILLALMNSILAQDTVTITSYKEPSRGPMIHGKKNGVWTSWTATGEIVSQGNYRNDSVEGKWTYYNIQNADTAISSGDIRNGKKNGVWIFSRHNGESVEYTELRDDIYQGKSTTYMNNIIAGQRHFENNLLTGEETFYYDYPRKREVRTYDKGLLNGKWEYYYPSGKLMGTCVYVKNQETSCQCWDESGVSRECHTSGWSIPNPIPFSIVTGN